jgi:dTDP-4-dehydrorhamnose reductase
MQSSNHTQQHEEGSERSSHMTDCSCREKFGPHGPRALIFGGKRGLLGQALTQYLGHQGWETVAQGSEDVDIFDRKALQEYIQRVEPDCVLNALGYTQVDRAEDEPELAYKLNATFPGILAECLQDNGAYLISYSTDYVFDGLGLEPYSCEDVPRPKSVYGKSKLAGERTLLDSGMDQLIVIRTSWLFGPWRTNFVQKIIEQAKQSSNLKVVHDQVGSPTYTLDLACYTCKLFQHDVSGIFHICNSGQASWCELAAEALGISGKSCTVQPLTSQEYRQQASRPAFSVLDASRFSQVTGEKPRPWMQALRDYMYFFETHEMDEDV